MDDEQVDRWGRLFARILDKREGIGSQDAVDRAIEDVMENIPPPPENVDSPTGGDR